MLSFLTSCWSVYRLSDNFLVLSWKLVHFTEELKHPLHLLCISEGYYKVQLTFEKCSAILRWHVQWKHTTWLLPIECIIFHTYVSFIKLLLGRSVLFLVRRPLELLQWYWPNIALGGVRFFCSLQSLTVEGRVTNHCSRLYLYENLNNSRSRNL